MSLHNLLEIGSLDEARPDRTLKSWLREHHPELA